MTDQALLAVLMLQLCVLHCARDVVAGVLAGLGLVLLPLSSYGLNQAGYYLYSKGYDAEGLNAVFFNDECHMVIQGAIVAVLASISLKKHWLCLGYGVMFLFVFASFYGLSSHSTVIFYAIGYTCEVVLILTALKCEPRFDKFDFAHNHDSYVDTNNMDCFEGMA